MPLYLDYAATTPLHPEVRNVLIRAFDELYGNAGSRTHAFGADAKRAVEVARAQVSAAASADSSEVIFTSGATEANNLAILGIEAFARAAGRTHLVTTAIEHKAVLEPHQLLAARGFDLSVVPVGLSGRVEPAAVAATVRPDTVLVSVMHANNETGGLQPLAEIAEALRDHPAYFHVDAAQGFAKAPGLEHPRIDLIAASGHKLMGPKGIGALIARRRGYDRPPLAPLMVGGGQERGLRPGTLPVPLIVAFGAAVAMAVAEREARWTAAAARRARALEALRPLNPVVIGGEGAVLPHILSLAFPGVDSEALILALRDVVAISNGSACTSASYEPSHVLTAMGLPPAVCGGAVRFSFDGAGEEPPWETIAREVSGLSAPAWAS